MSNAERANALLRGEIDVNQYWRESGEQQVRSAGVFLTHEQQQRALKNLARLVLSLQRSGVCLAVAQSGIGGQSVTGADDDLHGDFATYLATFR